MKLRITRLIGAIILMACLLAGGYIRANAENGSAPLVENKDVYSGYDSKLVYLYVTVVNDDKKKEDSLSFKDIVAKKYDPNEKRDKVKVIIQSGNAEGPDSLFSGQGSIKVRGKSTARSKYKSFQIKLDKNKGAWLGQTTINLNKHVFDITRVRNKVSFDYFKIIPNYASFRTCFVNLRVKDTTDGSSDKNFVDYGLYTQIEQPGKQYLQEHGLDPKGNLYKAQFFEFLRYPDQLKEKTDPTYDADKFEQILEIKGSKDHKKLLKMLDDLNNYQMPIGEVIDKHFNMDNIMTWLAINVLLGNIDTNSQNFMLYSPSNSETWYFLPWDCDGAWDYYHQVGKTNSIKAKWQSGLSNYWGMVLFKRIFREPKNLEKLKKKIDQISGIMSEERTMSFLKSYYGIVSPFVRRNPDKGSLPGDGESFDAEYYRIPKIPEQKRKMFNESLDDPMPIFLGVPEKVDNKYKFIWEASFDLQGDELTYQFQLSDTPDFKNNIAEKELKGTEYTVGNLKPGVYYWRVIVRDKAGNFQIAFDSYRGETERYYGVKQLVIQ